MHALATCHALNPRKVVLAYLAELDRFALRSFSKEDPFTYNAVPWPIAKQEPSMPGAAPMFTDDAFFAMARRHLPHRYVELLEKAQRAFHPEALPARLDTIPDENFNVKIIIRRRIAMVHWTIRHLLDNARVLC